MLIKAGLEQGVLTLHHPMVPYWQTDEDEGPFLRKIFLNVQNNYKGNLLKYSSQNITSICDQLYLLMY